MSKANYVTREDGIPVMITAESDFDCIDLEEILDDYPYITESMNEEEYCLESELCFAFDELLFENKVVGFAAFELHGQHTLLLTDCYILPEFRGKQLFFNEICKMIFSAPQFGILQPTRNVVQLLIDYSFAKKVSDDIVVSGIDFYVNSWDVKSNKSEKIFHEIPASNFYDLGICSTILVDADEVIYHNLLDKDLIKYGERKELTEDYFNATAEFFFNNQSEFEKLIMELKEELPQEKWGYDVIVGEGEELSEFMQSIVDNEVLSYDNALEIKQQLIREYESGEITEDDIDDRFTHLLMGKMSYSQSFEEFQDFIDSPEVDGEDMQVIKELFDVIGDDEELRSSIFNAILSDDESKFENLIINAMNNDEEFSRKFLELADDYNQNDLQLADDEYLDLTSLGLNPDSPYPVAEMMWGSNDGKYKLDDTYYGKDYPISHDIYIFRILKSLKKHGSLKIAMAIAGMGGQMTSYAVESQLFMQNLISDEVNYDNWDEFAHNSLTIKDLKSILRKNNLKVSGKKQELIDRIAENQIPLDEFSSDKAILTPDGEEFLQQNKWIEFYDTFLEKFDFNDFVKYLDNNEGEFIELVLKYLKMHLKLAESENNSTYVADCIIAQEMISKEGHEFFKNNR